MELTKETLKQFLDDHPAISPRGLALHAGVNENAINQLYNKSNKNLTKDLKGKLLKVLVLYGFLYVFLFRYVYISVLSGGLTHYYATYYLLLQECYTYQ